MLILPQKTQIFLLVTSTSSTGCSVRQEKLDATKLAWTLPVLMLFCIHAMVEKEIRFVPFSAPLTFSSFLSRINFSFSSGHTKLTQNNFTTNRPTVAWPSAVTTKSFLWKIVMDIVKLKSGCSRTMTEANWLNSRDVVRHTCSKWSGSFHRNKSDVIVIRENIFT